MLSRLKYISLIGSILLVSGCARPPVVAKPLSDSRICCKSLASIPTEALQIGQVRSVHFDAASSPVLHFPEGNGVFAAFRLPDPVPQSSLRIRTWLSSSVLPVATFVKPNAMFLDADFHIIDSPRDASLLLAAATWQGIYGEAIFSVPAHAVFLIVYSGNARAKRLIVRSANGNWFAIPFAYSGNIDVTLSRSE